MNKEEILSLAREKGVKLSFLNDLIGGYRGKLTEWKNGKTSLTEKEITVIADYLTSDSGKEIRDEDIQFALFDGAKEVTPAMFEEVKAFAKFVQAREAEKAKDKKKD